MEHNCLISPKDCAIVARALGHNLVSAVLVTYHRTEDAATKTQFDNHLLSGCVNHIVICYKGHIHSTYIPFEVVT